MKRMIVAACAIIAGPMLSCGSALAYSEGSSEFVNNVFRQQTRVSSSDAGRSRAQRTTRSARRSSDRGYYRSNSGSLSGDSGATGVASYYWQPQRVASGGWFNPNDLTAAHRSLPFGTRVRVTNLSNGRSVVVRINDRGPFIRGRIIDLSRRAAGVVGMTGSGLARVKLDVVG